MRLARIIGTATATIKQPSLTGAKLMVTDVIDGAGAVVTPAIVAVDTCGAGVGETVLLAEGSAARLPAALAGAPVDAAIVAVVDHVDIAAQKPTPASRRRKT